MVAQSGNAVFGHHASGRLIRFTAPIKMSKTETDPESSADRFKHIQPFRNDFLSDAVAGHYRNLICFQESPSELKVA